MSLVRLRTANLLVAALGLLASGCAGGSDAKPTTLPSLTATPSASTSAAVIPTPARAHTPQGAAAFVRFYFVQVNKAFTTADPGSLAALSDPECSSCRNYIATAEKFRSDGRHIRGVAVRVISAEAPPEESGFIAVDAFLDAPSRDIVTFDGTLIEHLPPDPTYHRTVFVKMVSSGWTVRAVKKLDS